MRTSILPLLLLGLACPARAGEAAKDKASGRKPVLTLESSAFKAGGAIPKRFTGDGEDVSPELRWAGAPAKTKSFVLIMDDPDAPPGTWVHWVVYGIPADATALAEGLPKTPKLPNGARQGECWGVAEFERVGYHGPQPPKGKPHHYSFRLYALDIAPELPEKATKKQLEKAMRKHVLAKAELIGLYQR